MKRKMLLWLIRRLKNEIDNKHFRMSSYLYRNDKGESCEYTSEGDIPHCKTAGCIAGTVFLGMKPKERQKLIPKNTNLDYWDADVHEIARKRLGLTAEQASELFSPDIPLNEITRKHAIKVLEIIRDKGVLDWSLVLPKKLFQEENWGVIRNFTTPMKIELTK